MSNPRSQSTPVEKTPEQLLAELQEEQKKERENQKEKRENQVTCPILMQIFKTPVLLIPGDQTVEKDFAIKMIREKGKPYGQVITGYRHNLFAQSLLDDFLRDYPDAIERQYKGDLAEEQKEEKQAQASALQNPNRALPGYSEIASIINGRHFNPSNQNHVEERKFQDALDRHRAYDASRQSTGFEFTNHAAIFQTTMFGTFSAPGLQYGPFIGREPMPIHPLPAAALAISSASMATTSLFPALVIADAIQNQNRDGVHSENQQSSAEPVVIHQRRVETFVSQASVVATLSLQPPHDPGSSEFKQIMPMPVNLPIAVAVAPGALPLNGSQFHPLKVCNGLLLGDANSGKCEFLQEITRTNIINDEISTIGIEFKSKIMGDVNFRIWDTAGQERFPYLAGYLPNTKFILFFGDNVDNVNGWIQQVKNHKPALELYGIDYRDGIFYPHTVPFNDNYVETHLGERENWSMELRGAANRRVSVTGENVLQATLRLILQPQRAPAVHHEQKCSVM